MTTTTCHCDVCPVCGQAESQRCEQCVGPVACAAGAPVAPARLLGPAVGGTCRSRPGFSAGIGEQPRGHLVPSADLAEGSEL